MFCHGDSALNLVESVAQILEQKVLGAALMADGQLEPPDATIMAAARPEPLDMQDHLKFFFLDHDDQSI